jgi:hypothetical protein
MKRIPRLILILAAASLLASCATSRYPRGPSAPPPGTKDNKPAIWSEDHPRVTRFRRHYARTETVETALRRSKSYMPYILPEFRRRRLPLQLAYLPMLESNFDPRADSGHARGLWQFIPGTAKEMGLRIGVTGDDRLDVRKSTRAAAEYLERLGERYNYNWALALAAYNCGPGCLDRAIQRERSWDFWELELRTETAEYVPRFIAMLQVAQQQYPDLIVAELQIRDNRRRLSQAGTGPTDDEFPDSAQSRWAVTESDDLALAVAELPATD